MLAIWKRDKNEINVNFCVPYCEYCCTNRLNFCSQLGSYRNNANSDHADEEIRTINITEQDLEEAQESIV